MPERNKNISLACGRVFVVDMVLNNVCSLGEVKTSTCNCNIYEFHQLFSLALTDSILAQSLTDVLKF